MSCVGIAFGPTFTGCICISPTFNSILYMTQSHAADSLDHGSRTRMKLMEEWEGTVIIITRTVCSVWVELVTFIVYLFACRCCAFYL